MNTQTIETKPSSPVSKILISLLFIVAGGLFAYFTSKNAITYIDKNKTYTETISKVVAYDHNNEGLASIVAEYTVEGRKYRLTSNNYSRNPKSKGTEVLVKYNPKNPEDAIWSNDISVFLIPLLGLLFVIGGIITLFAKRKPHQKINTNETTNNIQQPQNQTITQPDVTPTEETFKMDL